MPLMRPVPIEPLVVIVGGGPGDPGLITVAGMEWIRRADVILYDRLVSEELLESGPPQAERICVGKSPGGSGFTQEQINGLLIDKAREGKLVIRLKGGDPLVFGRGGEEAEALAGAGVPFRIVPGITSATAAASAAGIPLTDRREASSVALVTGHEDPHKPETKINWEALAGIETVVFYMPVGKLSEIADRLISAGRDPSTPAAVVQGVATPQQRTIVAALGTIPAAAEQARIAPPAILIIGDVVTMRDRIAWMEKLPLYGQTIVVTRPRTRANKLAAELRVFGANVILSPSVQIDQPDDLAPLDAALRNIGKFDWIALTSPTGSEVVLDRLGELDIDARALAGTRIAAVGPSTAQVLRDRSVNPDLIPEQFTTESLGRALISSERATGRKILLPRSDKSTPLLPDMLTAAGFEVHQIVAYRTIRPRALPGPALDALERSEVDWITFTSASTVSNFLDLIDQDKIDLSGIKLAAIGPVTAESLRTAGVSPTVTADPHTSQGLIEAILSAIPGPVREGP